MSISNVYYNSINCRINNRVRPQQRILSDELRVLFLQRRVLLAQQRLQFLNAQPIEIGKLTARSIDYLYSKVQITHSGFASALIL